MEETMKTLLLACSFGFDSSNRFVYCITCKIILLANAKRHVTKFHHRKLSKKHFRTAEEFFALNPPNLVLYNNVRKIEDLDPLPYLQVFKGFKCFNCFYCYIEES